MHRMQFMRVTPLPLIAIVGRPNVGKSTLFNRLIGQRRSIVTDEPGITRDRIYGIVSWNGRSYEIVDTGGIVPGEETEIPRSDLRTGADCHRQRVAHLLRRRWPYRHHRSRSGTCPPSAAYRKSRSSWSSTKSIRRNKSADVSEFYRLGIDHVFPVSSEHGRGITELLDEVAISMPAPEDEEKKTVGEIRVAIIGRPNVGKSTLLNKLVGQERAMVSPIAGTTRDAVDSVVAARRTNRPVC